MFQAFCFIYQNLKLSYIASFVAFPRAVLQIERGAQQRLMRGPWQAYPLVCYTA